jgi:hypothetical protein
VPSSAHAHELLTFPGTLDGRRYIIVTAPKTGKSVSVKVVDECDSVNGCDSEHAFQPPCQNNIVDGSVAVWRALGISANDPDYGYMDVTWRDA